MEVDSTVSPVSDILRLIIKILLKKTILIEFNISQEIDMVEVR